jgi:endonuclease YncB( thermonuclease family)
LYKVGFFQSQLSTQNRASHRGAFFVGCLFFLLALLVSPAWSVECPADRIDETVAVSRVVDGDTLRLKDGRLVRFIGINTPELARKGKPAESLAKKARQTLVSLLENSSDMVGLRYGTERKDRYGRTLAHVYLVNGISVEAKMLSAGMAAQIVVPPNVWNHTCYRAAEQSARQTGKGVWKNLYRPIFVAELSRQSRGFRFISGKVVRVGESKRSIWLNFPRRSGEGYREGVAVRISRKDLGHFKSWDPRQLKDKQVVVRGWVYPYKKQLVMQLRHPLALEITSSEK